MEKLSMKYFIQPSTIVLIDEAENIAWMQGIPEDFVPFSDVNFSSKVHAFEDLPDQEKEQVRLLQSMEESNGCENLRIYTYDENSTGDVIVGYAGNPDFFARLEWEAYLCLDDEIVNSWEHLWGNTYTTPLKGVLQMGEVGAEGIYFADPGDEWEEW